MEFLENLKNDVVKILYDCDGIKISAEDAPFQLKGGVVSPMFCDASVLEGPVETRGRVVSALLFWMNTMFSNVDAVVGVASGGISWATSLANCRCLDLLRAHAAPKDHGLCNQIDGRIRRDGANVVVIDDIITSGHSVLSVVDALREGKDGKRANVLAVFSIFDWDFPSVNKKFEEAGVTKHHITDFDTVLRYGFENNLFSDSSIENKNFSERIARFCEDFR